MSSTENPHVSFRNAVYMWAKIGLLSFGGPAAQIALMHRLLVDEKGWVEEERFLHALNYCMLLPGPEAMQLATYIGWLLHRTAGGLVAGILFVLPGFISILTLSILYALYHHIQWVEALFYGLKPAVLAVVIEACLRMSKRTLKNYLLAAVAAVAFIAIFFFNIPFPLVIAVAALLGALHHAPTADSTLAIVKHRIPLSHSLRTIAIYGTLWLAPVVGLYLWQSDNVFTDIAVFFSKMAVVTFGGAYSVLSYVAQQAVHHYNWLSAGEMLDGLGMAETTPGPLIQVLQYVAFIAGYRSPGIFTPLAGGILGSLLACWVTFMPCFLWIFLGAPYIEQLRNNHRLNSALSAITASVVGVVLNLAVWFALHVLFIQGTQIHYGALNFYLPLWQTLDPAAVLLAALATLFLLRFKIGMLPTLGISALAGVILKIAMA